MTAGLPLSGSSLLGVFAHPDDESLACGGLLAWCAALGVRVSLLCVTRGQHGPGGDTGAGASPDSLGHTRLRELRHAASTLGIAELSVLDHEDGMLPWGDAQRLEDDLLQAIRRTAPDVVITFDEDGLYWHPDHIAVHERTTTAVTRLGADAPALYYVSMPPGAMRAVVRHAAGAAGAAGPGGEAPDLIFGVRDADAFGLLAPPPTLIVDAGAFAARKLAALACHRSQLAGSALALIGADDAPRLLGIEHYRRAAAGARGDTFLDRLAARPSDRPDPGSLPCAPA
jgi:LmbE family N-acetylglucosaminyl deacetylase